MDRACESPPICVPGLEADHDAISSSCSFAPCATASLTEATVPPFGQRSSLVGVAACMHVDRQTRLYSSVHRQDNLY